MNILSNQYKNRGGAVLAGGKDLEGKYSDVINLSIGDPDITTPSVILKNASLDMEKGYTKYSSGRGYTELREKISQYYLEEYNLQVPIENISATTSGGYAMFQAFAVTLNPSDEVILFEPYFSPYLSQIEIAGGKAVFVQTIEEEDYQINFDRLEKAVTDKTKGLVLNYPSNPSGAVYSMETLEKIAAFAKKHDLIVYADDIYTAFCYKGSFTPIMSLDGMAERTITVNSFSKNYLMTGFRLANVVAPPYVLQAMSYINDSMVYSPPCYSQRAGIYAIEHRHEFTDSIINTFKERIEYGTKRINGMKNIHLKQPEGAFYLFPNIKATGKTSKEIVDILFEQAHIIATPGTAFGQSGEGYIRICATVSVDTLKEAFDRMEKLNIFK